MQQLVHLLIKNNILKNTTNDTTYEDFDKPKYDIKRGRDLHDKASEGLPTSEQYDLKYNTAQQYLKLLRMKSDYYSWGLVLNNILTSDRIKSLL